MTKPIKISTLTIKQMPTGRFVFELDGKAVDHAKMAGLCVAIVEVLRNQTD